MEGVMKISEDAQAAVRVAAKRVEDAKDSLAALIGGIKIGMGLKGEYNFDLRAMEFKETKHDEQDEERG